MKYKMKQKQNQRITRITEGTLVVGADIAKKIHVARLSSAKIVYSTTIETD